MVSIRGDEVKDRVDILGREAGLANDGGPLEDILVFEEQWHGDGEIDHAMGYATQDLMRRSTSRH